MASIFLQPVVFIIENNSSCSIETIDTSSKNKSSWSWLKEKDVNEDYLSKYVRKVNKDGVAVCLFCKAELKYGKRGRSCFLDHAKSKAHKKNRETFLSSSQLPLAFQCQKEKMSGKITITNNTPVIPYGADQNIVDAVGSSAHSSNSAEPPMKKAVPFPDRVTHAEAFVCSFIAEHSLPLAMAPHLINFAQVMSVNILFLQVSYV